MSVTGRVEPGGAGWGVALLRRTAVNLGSWIAALARRPRAPLPRLWPKPDRLAIGTVVAIVAVAALMLFVDHWVIVRQHLMWRWLVAAFDEFTDYGRSGWFLFPTAFLLLGIAAVACPALGRTTHLVLLSLAARIGFVFVAVGLPGLIFTVIKRLIGRARPTGQETDPFLYAPFSWQHEFASLPSGHATAAFSAAVAIGALFPRLRVVMWVYAVAIAVSRVVVVAHYPSDVVAGAVIGAFSALLVRNWFAMRRLGFAVGPDGAVKVLPGPSLRRLKRVAGRLLGQ